MKKLGRYRLVEVLGQGGMGDVYSAVSEGLGGFEKRVCVKVMRKELTGNERAVELFLREARLAARLTHPNIVQIFELGREQGVYFIAMEMLEGLPWHDIAQRCWRHGKVLPLEVIVAAAAQAAEALQYAHTLTDKDGKALGMVHRDVSPDNLFLTTDGTTKVLDFGIAKAMSGDSTRLTEKGELRGKLPYMPPEQVKTDDVTGAADTWALGITLFYLSTAQRPFDRDSPLLTMNAILKEPAISAMSMNAVLPKSFADVIARCLAKEPKDRWPSAAAVKEALLNLLPVPPDPQKNRELLALATSLEKGDRQPLTAHPAAPSMSWDKRPPPAAPLAAPPIGTRPEDRLPSRKLASSSSAAASSAASAAASSSSDNGPPSQSLSKPRPPAPKVEKTTVSAPMLTADESAEASVMRADDDVSSEEQENDFGLDQPTLAEMPSLSDDADDSSEDDEPAPTAEPTVAVAMSLPDPTRMPERGPEQPDFHQQVTAPERVPAGTTASAPSLDLPLPMPIDFTPEAPTRTSPKPEKDRALVSASHAKPRPQRETPKETQPTKTKEPLPVWVFGVAAFGATVLVALIIVAIVNIARG